MTIELLSYTFMRRALVAALLVGVAAPAVGVHLVQRRLSLIGDGLGHVALAGVALGLLTGTTPIGAALVVTVLGAIAVEAIRAQGPAAGNVALALMFYGGIAGGVVLMARTPDSTASSLTAYLFGAITTTSSGDLWVFAALTALVLIVTRLGGRLLLAVGLDEEHAAASGLPVRAVNLVLAVVTAVTVVVSMRVVGLLLISALMIVPVAAAQLVARSFRSTVNGAMVLGSLCAVTGVVVSYYADTPSGGTIVLVSIAVYLVLWMGMATTSALRSH